MLLRPADCQWLHSLGATQSAVETLLAAAVAPTTPNFLKSLGCTEEVIQTLLAAVVTSEPSSSKHVACVAAVGLSAPISQIFTDDGLFEMAVLSLLTEPAQLKCLRATCRGGSILAGSDHLWAQRLQARFGWDQSALLDASPAKPLQRFQQYARWEQRSVQATVVLLVPSDAVIPRPLGGTAPAALVSINRSSGCAVSSNAVSLGRYRGTRYREHQCYGGEQYAGEQCYAGD